MIQIYRQDNIDYRHNGDMTLLPEEAIIHVILNGEWTANIEHPIDLEGRWKYIEENAVVKMPSFNGIQLFRIRSKEKKDSGVSAELTPIFMDAKEDCFLVDVRPTNKSGQEALDVMTEKTPQYQAKSDIKKVSTAYYQTMNLIEAINGSDDNAFVSRWGGEILYDNYQVIINEKAGGDYNLTTSAAGSSVLDAYQGKVLDGKKLNTANVINNLLTTEAGYALDARQGKKIEDQITELNGKLNRKITYDETETGEIVVGKKIYSKSIWQTHLPSNGTELFDLNLPSDTYYAWIDSGNSYIYKAGYSDIFPIPYINPRDGSWANCVGIKINAGKLAIFTSTDWTGYGFFVTIKYTKK